MNEYEYETEFVKNLKASQNFHYIHRQFCTIHRGSKRLDVLAIDLNFDMWIFELKVEYHKKHLGQIADYLREFKPKYAILVTPDLPNFKEFGGVGYWQFVSEVGVLYRYDGIERDGRSIPMYMQLRMSADYVCNKKHVWFDEIWTDYNRRILYNHGYVTKAHRKQFWHRSAQLRKISKRKLEEQKKQEFNKVNPALDYFLNKYKEQGETDENNKN